MAVKWKVQCNAKCFQQPKTTKSRRKKKWQNMGHIKIKIDFKVGGNSHKINTIEL